MRKAAQQRRRQALAAAAVAGASIASVARAEGISRTWASQEAHAPGTQVLIAELLDEHKDRIKSLVARSLDVVADALEATKPGVGGPEVDHYTRLQGTRRLLQFALAGRKSGQAPSEEPEGVCTMETLVRIYERTIQVQR